VTIDALASQVDLAPTFADWAEAAVPDFVDGRSLLPVLSGDPTPAEWRKVLLIEQFANNPARTEKQPAFEALRLPHLIYVEYGSDERELYDLIADPQEIENLATTADPALLAALAERVALMESCAGNVCREVEREPLPKIVATPTA
jgi:arylsulfatase A-like enzyme